MRYINDRYRRTGTLWEGRYKCCPVQDETYLLRCYRYIELNPVRAGMVADPADYPWSSHARNGQDKADALIQPHARYTEIATAEARAATYRRFVMEVIDPDETQPRPASTRSVSTRGGTLDSALLSNDCSDCTLTPVPLHARLRTTASRGICASSP